MNVQFVWLEEDVMIRKGTTTKYIGRVPTYYWQCEQDGLLVLVEHVKKEVLRVHECPQCFEAPSLLSAQESLLEIRRQEALAELFSLTYMLSMDEAWEMVSRKQIAGESMNDLNHVEVEEVDYTVQHAIETAKAEMNEAVNAMIDDVIAPIDDDDDDETVTMEEIREEFERLKANLPPPPSETKKPSRLQDRASAGVKKVGALAKTTGALAGAAALLGGALVYGYQRFVHSVEE